MSKSNKHLRRFGRRTFNDRDMVPGRLILRHKYLVRIDLGIEHVEVIDELEVGVIIACQPGTGGRRHGRSADHNRRRFGWDVSILHNDSIIKLNLGPSMGQLRDSREFVRTMSGLLQAGLYTPQWRWVTLD